MFFQHVRNVQANCQETFEGPVFNVKFILKGAQVLDFGTLGTKKSCLGGRLCIWDKKKMSITSFEPDILHLVF
jgi:hypothetical protein